MNTIKIGVYKQLDGYNFSISPSMRDYVRKVFPNSYPANNIFVGYDTKSDFEKIVGRLETYIYRALLGIPEESDAKQLGMIEFVDAETGESTFIKQ